MDLFTKYKTSVTNLVYIISLLALVSTSISGLVKGLSEFGLVFWISLGILICCLIYVIANYYFQRRIPPRLSGELKPEANLIRGIQPFEKGQPIIGRDREIKQLITILESRDFEFGYVSGEAGAGKTSLVRAGILDLMTDKGWSVFYFASVNEIVNLDFGVGGSGKDGVFKEEVLSQATGNAPDKNTLIIIDQFEELFISRLKKEDRSTFSVELARLLQEGKVKVLLCLRKEFVEDLRSFSPAVKDAKSDARSIYVENWEVREAQEYFRTMCDRDGVRIAIDLREEIVADIANRDMVRPVELQIVSKYCIDSGIQYLNDFRKAGKSKGILADFIVKILDKNSTDHKDLEKLTGKYILRMLCNDTFDTKRADGGIQYEDLYKDVRKSLESSFKRGAAESEYQAVFPVVLENFLEHKLVMAVSDRKYNLYHDYLVKSIKEATANLQTAGEIATELVSKYLYRQSAGFKQLIGVREYLFIRRYLPKQAFLSQDVRKLLSRQRSSYTRYGSFTILMLIGLLTYFFPPRIVYSAPVKVSDYEVGLYGSDSSYRKRFYVKINDSLYHINIDRGSSGSFFKLYYSDHSSRFNGRDSLMRTIALPGKEFVWDGLNLSVLDTLQHTLAIYQLVNGDFRLEKRLGLPAFFSQGHFIYPIETDNYNYRSGFTDYFIDFGNRSFVAANSRGLAFSDDLFKKGMEELVFPVALREKQYLGVVKINDDLLIQPKTDTNMAYIFRKGKRIIPMDSGVCKFFFNKQLQFDGSNKYLYFYDTAAREVRIFSAFIPAHFSDLSVPWARVPFDSAYFSADHFSKGKMSSGFSIDIKVMDSLVSMIAVQYFNKTIFYLHDAHEENVKNLHLSLLDDESFFIFKSNPHQAVIIAYGRSSLRGHGHLSTKIYTIDNGNVSVQASSYGILNIQNVDSSHLDLILEDSLQYPRLGRLDKHTLRLEPGNLFSNFNKDNQHVLIWAKDGNHVYYLDNDVSIYLGDRSGVMELIYTIPPAYQGNGGNGYPHHKDLFVPADRGYFAIRRNITIWGIKCWSLDWPEFNEDQQ